MPTALTDLEKADIIALHDQGLTRNDIARRTRRGTGTITKTIKNAGRTFDRAPTKHATAARAADAAAIRAELKVELLQLAKARVGEVRRLQDGGRYRLVHVAGNGTVIDLEVSGPPAKDRQHLATEAAIWLDKAMALERVDGADDSEARSFLDRLMDGVVAIADGASA